MSTELEALRNRLEEFRTQRGWEQFHSPRNLAMAVASEVGELLGAIRWLTDDEISHRDAALDATIRDEIADITIFLVLLSDSLGIDLISAANDKTDRNEQRFPI